jgi:glycine hydroxymethyltransferase
LVNEDEALNKKLNFAVFPESQGGPLMHVIAAKAVCFKEAMADDYVAYQTQVVKNAQAMAETFISRGIKVVSGGTDDHLFLVDLIDKEYTGKDADAALGRANITVNKNSVPNDPRSPFVTSGLRIGSPAVTSRGFKEAECIDLTNWICDVLAALETGTSDAVEAEVQAKVVALCATLPVYK